jgi:hypothetical protein
MMKPKLETREKTRSIHLTETDFAHLPARPATTVNKQTRLIRVRPTIEDPVLPNTGNSQVEIDVSDQVLVGIAWRDDLADQKGADILPAQPRLPQGIIAKCCQIRLRRR